MYTAWHLTLTRHCLSTRLQYKIKSWKKIDVYTAHMLPQPLLSWFKSNRYIYLSLGNIKLVNIKQLEQRNARPGRIFFTGNNWDNVLFLENTETCYSVRYQENPLVGSCGLSITELVREKFLPAWQCLEWRAVDSAPAFTYSVHKSSPFLNLIVETDIAWIK